MNRGALRARYSIKGNFVFDAVTWFLCTCCALAQEIRYGISTGCLTLNPVLLTINPKLGDKAWNLNGMSKPYIPNPKLGGKAWNLNGMPKPETLHHCP